MLSIETTIHRPILRGCKQLKITERSQKLIKESDIFSIFFVISLEKGSG